jgi:hypothetical protein
MWGIGVTENTEAQDVAGSSLTFAHPGGVQRQGEVACLAANVLSNQSWI